jgi:hypothetical protein
MWDSVQLLLVTETEGKLRMYSNLAGDSSAVFECPTIYPKIVDLNPASAGNRGRGKLRMYSNLVRGKSAVFEWPTLDPKIEGLNPAAIGSSGRNREKEYTPT